MKKEKEEKKKPVKQKRRKKIKKVEDVTEVKFEDYEKSVPELLDRAGFKQIIKDKKRIFLKPNLTLCKPFPITTDVVFVEEIVKYIKKCNKKTEIIIAEGSGGDPTEKCFEKLGYKALSDKYKIPLLDLNETETKRIYSDKFKKFNFIEYPKALLTGFLISLPVLKEHGEAGVTISLKNMLGAFPARFYKSSVSSWKGKVHRWPIEYSIHDILACKFPDYAICDASIVLLEKEIHGYPKELDILLVGKPLEVDKRGSLLLGHDWKRIPHLVLADELKHGKVELKRKDLR